VKGWGVFQESSVWIVECDPDAVTFPENATK